MVLVYVLTKTLDISCKQEINYLTLIKSDETAVEKPQIKKLNKNIQLNAQESENTKHIKSKKLKIL